ncbi:putative Zinc knuckle-containing protein 11 [Homarus americanus]|uniref:Putative Zinc knuckle-containing protein 11 n=1 Tax=Homarus americanus TaxID=6706 RepID=A0A8J5JT00_HOMAM|nr:putative Zinc knuckle-containing protein 11 [Homarus americanus]
MRLNKYTKGPAAGLLNGTRTFKVNLKNNIPSSVAVGGHSLTFLYAEQRKTCYKCGHEGHLAIDCHTEEVDKVNIFNEEDFPAIQLSGEIHSSRAGVKEGEESVTVSQVPATTRHGVEREVPAETISQDAVDPEGTTHPDGSENAAQETSTTCEAEIHTERNNVDQTKGKIFCGNMKYDKADDMEATIMTGTECEVAGENMDRMKEIVEVTCSMSPSRNKNDASKKDQNKPGEN